MPELFILVNIRDHVAWITLKKPVIDREIAQALQEVCADLNANNDVYAVVFTGYGTVFCAGGEKDAAGAAAAIASLEKPVIAMVNGEAFGEGMEIALAADIRIAAENVTFGLPQIKDGQLPGDGATQRLPRIVGRGKALELLMTAETIKAAQALEIGLVSKVTPAADLHNETEKLASAIAAKGPVALRYLKEAIIKGMDMTLEQGLRLEADLYFLLHTTSDRAEGIKSYLEKRNPKYEGK